MSKTQQYDAAALVLDRKARIAARKRVVDAFHSVGVGPEDLVVYLGHKIEQTSPAELDSLRSIYTAIKEGETSWTAVMEQEFSSSSEEVKARTQQKAAKLKERLLGQPKPEPTPEPNEAALRQEELAMVQQEEADEKRKRRP